MEINNIFEPSNTGLQSAVTVDDNSYGFEASLLENNVETVLNNDSTYLDFVPDVSEQSLDSLAISDNNSDDLTGANSSILLDESGFDTPLSQEPEPLASFEDDLDQLITEYANLIVESGLFESNLEDFIIGDLLVDINDLDFTTVNFAGVSSDGTLSYTISEPTSLFPLTINTDFRAIEVNPDVISRNFDPDYYTQTYPEVLASGLDPLTHYRLIGTAEGKDPNLFFDTSFYLENNPDVAADGINPLEHFNTSGWIEERKPDPLFDTSYYLRNNTDVIAARANPLEQFNLTGWQERRDPNALFDTSFYLAANPDVANANINPLKQYSISGWKSPENRNTSISFSTAYYKDKHGINTNPLESYFLEGQEIGLETDSIFEFPDQVLVAQSVWDEAGQYLNPLYWAIVGGVLIYEGATNTVEFIGNVGKAIFFSPDTGEIPTGTPPFPGNTEGVIEIKVLPEGNIDSALENNIFDFPIEENGIEYELFPTEDGVLGNILRGPFIFPNQNLGLPYYSQINTNNDGLWDDFERDLSEMNQYGENFDTGSWAGETEDSVYESIEYHYGKHDEELMVNSVKEYVEQSEKFKKRVLEEGIEGTPVPGRTPNVKRYRLDDKYIDLVLVDGVFKIISFGSIF